MKKVVSLTLAFALLIALMTVPASADGMMAREDLRYTIYVENGIYAIIDENDDLWMWGGNSYGMLGNGTATTGESEPFKVLDNVKSVYLAWPHAAAIKNDGTLWMWGRNYGGEFGFFGGNDFTGVSEYSVNYIGNQTTPVKVMDHVVAYCHGEGHAVLKDDGSLWYWTDTFYDDVKNDGTAFSKIKKIADNVVQATFEDYDVGVAYITSDNTLWYLDEVYKKPVKTKVMDDVKAVSCSSYFSWFVIKTDNSLWSWGNNAWGQLGNGSLDKSETPVKIMDDVSYIHSEESSVLAIKNDGTLWVWGNSDHLRITKANVVKNGLMGFRAQTIPLKIMDDVAFAVNSHNGLVVKKTDGTFWINPDKRWKQVELPDTGNNVTDEPTQQLPPASDNGFADVVQTAYYAEPVKWAVEKGITTGTTATTFSPDNTCTNAQILTFLWRAAGAPEPSIKNPFSNVKTSDYFYKAALWAYEKGMVSGKKFDSTAPCTRSQTVMYLWQAAGMPAVGNSAAFTDVSADAVYAQAVTWAVEKGVTTGTSATAFSPDSTCTRGQIVTFLYRAFAE